MNFARLRGAQTGIVAFFIAALALTGCTTNHKSSPAAHDSTSPASQASSGLPAGVRQDVPPTDIPNEPSVRKDVAMTTCSKSANGWSASGIASNSGKATKTYDITIFFLTAGGTVIGHASTKTTVGAGAKSKWTAKAAFTPAPTTRCALRGVA